MTAPSALPRKKKPSVWAKIRVWLLRLLLALLAVFLGLLLFDSFVEPVSTPMLARWVTGRKVERVAVPLEKISAHLQQAVISSEDARFCLHSGVDWGALRIVVAARRDGGQSRGASTIDMQTVKNLFLFPGRLVLRKAVEIPLTLGLNLVWSKPRILSAYLNVAEWGDGIFGAEAAARRYFGKPASSLTPREAALLAVALPNPLKRDPRRPGALHTRMAARIMARMASGGAPTFCLKP
ncbi:monofunctional biosynthetic peptidoglycan transglycosylase [uncultured Rhodoblastus sp.]|uniref:monofunctional biosynthetic peptidoglycan transglycosylase n=1 Tax=uncultured Rhodoblastus sp. TaxID=543037 RepID=UPI0025E48638|nr:monofunctional biosynthetic peptidoglycan transglycosylase [uncultured Rhodoblastus sp.]